MSASKRSAVAAHGALARACRFEAGKLLQRTPVLACAHSHQHLLQRPLLERICGLQRPVGGNVYFLAGLPHARTLDPRLATTQHQLARLSSPAPGLLGRAPPVTRAAERGHAFGQHALNRLHARADNQLHQLIAHLAALERGGGFSSNFASAILLHGGSFPLWVCTRPISQIGLGAACFKFQLWLGHRRSRRKPAFVLGPTLKAMFLRHLWFRTVP